MVRRKLEQSAERTLAGEMPSRVPVMARLQLLPAQARFSRATLARAADTRDRTTANFILTDLVGGLDRWVVVGDGYAQVFGGQ